MRKLSFSKQTWTEHKYFILLTFFVVALGAILRFYHLGSVPHGLAWDEAAIGYNGYAIFTTRRDEWLTRLPISFRSFGDYKAPLAIYINGFSTAVFGLTPFAVRLPFVLSSIAGMIGFIALTLELWRFDKHKAGMMAVAALSIVTLPWHFHYSRIAFESGLALSLVLWSLWAWFRFVIDRRITWQLFWITIATFSASASLYAYHSSKITVPLMFALLVILHWRRLVERRWGVFLGLVLASVTLFPLVKDAISADGLQRAEVTVFSQTDNPIEALGLTFKHLLTHFHPDFLVLGQTTSLRHGDSVWGVLLPTTYFLVLTGFLYVLWQFVQSKRLNSELQSYQWSVRVSTSIFLILFGLLPAAIGSEVPHSNRALLAIPGFLFMALHGVEALWVWAARIPVNQKIKGTHGENDLARKALFGTLILLHSLEFMAYTSHYFYEFSHDSAAAFADGYIEAFSIAHQYEKGVDLDQPVDTILVSDKYGQPYIYALFVRKTNPIWYQGGSLQKYQFSSTLSISDLDRKNTLIIATPNDNLPTESAFKTIYGSDSSPRFYLYLNQL